MHRLLYCIAVALFLGSCAGSPIKRGGSTRVVHVATVVELELVGIDRYKTKHSSSDFGRDHLVRLLDHYFSRNNDKIAGTRPAIVVYSHTSGRPEDDESGPTHLAPIVAAAQRYGCDVYVIQPASGGVKFIPAVYEMERQSHATSQD
jgi:hypothetical protein